MFVPSTYLKTTSIKRLFSRGAFTAGKVTDIELATSASSATLTQVASKFALSNVAKSLSELASKICALKFDIAIVSHVLVSPSLSTQAP